MDPKECAGVAISEFHGGIHGDHISGHSRGIGTSLNSDMVEFYALPKKCKKKKELENWKIDGDPFYIGNGRGEKKDKD